jgi:signal transduction histidine kinase
MEEQEKITFIETLLPFLIVIFLIVLGVLLLNQQFNKKLYRQKLEKDELKLRYQQELLRSSIQVQEDERKRIARDLHDELGAALSMARMHLVQLEQQHRESEHLPQTLNEIREIVESALTSMRRISHELIPPQLESFGLLQTLEVLRTQINGLEEIEMDIDFSLHFPRFAIDIELGLYRVCLELINNTLRHADAGKIAIRLSATHSTLQLAYSDDGKGLPEAGTEPGLGHKNIEARINALGGTFSLENHPDHPGVQALIHLPVN